MAYPDVVGGITDDKKKLATLIGHWVEHNEGHRESYLEWRAKLDAAQLPQTARALDRIAELTEDMNRELAKASEELEGREGGETSLTSSAEAYAPAPAHTHHEHDHSH